MSAKFLYRALGIRGYELLGEDYPPGLGIFRIEQRRSSLRCPVCGSAAVAARGGEMRQFRTVPLGGRELYVQLRVPRVSCDGSGLQRQVTVSFASARVRYTHSFERYALELSRPMTIQDAARHLHVGWDTIKEIQRRHLEAKYAKPRLKDIRLLGIDEVYQGSAGGYLTVVADLETGAVVFVGPGKGAKTLEPFWRRLKSSGAVVEAVSTDMSKAYLSAVAKHLPKAVHVLDHFHVVKLYNEKLTELRRELFRKAADAAAKKVLKGTRWLLLKNPENLDEDKDELQRLADALDLNRDLAIAYYLKDDLKQIWLQSSEAAAGRVLDDWVRRAYASGIAILGKFADTLVEHRQAIINYHRYPISTAKLEAINGKIQMLKRQARGFRDQEFFFLKIYDLHNAKHAIVG